MLASSKGDHLTTMFYYCRSIAVKFPFPSRPFSSTCNSSK
ncbi:hypothetical protein [Escherichia coli]